MRNCSESSGINVPFEVLSAHSEFIYALFKFFKRSLSLRSSDDFSDFREKHICSADCLAVLILLHVECLDVLRIVSKDYRLLEMLLHQVSLMFALQVHAPFYRVFELLS